MDVIGENIEELQGLMDLFKEAINFPVWPIVFIISIGSIFLVQFSPIAELRIVRENKGIVVFIFATVVGAAAGMFHILITENFRHWDFLEFQLRLMTSYMLSVIIYHVAGIKLLVKYLKKKYDLYDRD